MKEYKKPFIGAAYYPEDWPESEMDDDIAKMKEIGINVVRIGEFAWKKMEPQEGVFDFGWLHEVVDKLAEADIRVIMGTPTAVPPKWLTLLDKEMLIEDECGHRVSHGGRRHACSNNPTYLEHCDKIVAALAREFGEDENIIGWQIDNELDLQSCHCRYCENKFREYLQKRFGSIEELNRLWNLNLFSAAYDSFEDVEIPRLGWMNNHLRIIFSEFDGDSQIGFAARQAAILKKYVKAPVGTDQRPFNRMDYRELHRPMDVVQFNHYNAPDDLWESCLWMDYIRGFKDTPFWNIETSTCWKGSSRIHESIKPDGFCRVNSWLPIALGGEANMYWLWRTHWAGHELMHGSVLESSGRPQYNVPEVIRVAEEFQKASEFVTGTKVETRVALHFTAKNDKLFLYQPMLKGFFYERNLKDYFYRPIIDSGLRPDVIDARAELEKYSLIFSPLMAILDEYGLPERIAEWVKTGGVWVTGPMTDIRTADGTKYRDRLHGMLESLTPAQWNCFVPDYEKTVTGQWKDGSAFGGNLYYELFQPVESADHVIVKSGSKYIEGLSVLQQYKVGKGTVIILGTLPDYEDMRRIITHACKEADIVCNRTEGNSILVADRKGEDKKGVILMDICGRGGVYYNGKRLRDVLTGNQYDGDITVEPYSVLVLEE